MQTTNFSPVWFDKIQWDPQGLLPVVVQSVDTKDVLMVAWMNSDALLETIRLKKAVFWSRSRQQLWRKGEISGNEQTVVEIRLDCDGDTLLLLVHGHGPACHTGRAHCFYHLLQDHANEHQWAVVDPVLKDPKQMYGG